MKRDAFTPGIIVELEWVLTGKLPLRWLIRRCMWTWIPILKRFRAFCEKCCTALGFRRIEKQHGVPPRQCILPYVNIDDPESRRRRYKLCCTCRVEAQVTWYRPMDYRFCGIFTRELQNKFIRTLANLKRILKMPGNDPTKNMIDRVLRSRPKRCILRYH